MAKYFKITKNGESVYIKNSTRGIIDPDRNNKRLEEVLSDIETIAEGWSIVRDTENMYHLQDWQGNNRGFFTTTGGSCCGGGTAGSGGGGNQLTIDLTPYLTKTLISEIYATILSLQNYYTKEEVDKKLSGILDDDNSLVITEPRIGKGLKIDSKGMVNLDINEDGILTFGNRKFILSEYMQSTGTPEDETEKNIIYYGSYGDSEGALTALLAKANANSVTYSMLRTSLSQYGVSKKTATVSVPGNEGGVWNKSAYFVMFPKGLYTVLKYMAATGLGTTTYTEETGLFKSVNGGVYDIWYIVNAGISQDNTARVLVTLKLNT